VVEEMIFSREQSTAELCGVLYYIFITKCKCARSLTGQSS